ncbi:MAG TPA: DUF92 domain-containing protein [Sphingobacteriaceae bacterium]
MDPLLPVLVVILAGMFYSLKARKLTPAGSVTGAGLAGLIFLGTGLTGFVLMTVFFVLGTAATGWRRKEKERLAGIQDSGPRTALQVMANAGIGAILATATLVLPDFRHYAVLMLAAAFSSAASDTLSSELGTVYGRRFFHILTLRPAIRGNNGVVSIEGTLWGIAGSVIVAGIYSCMEGWGPDLWRIVLAGTIGNLSDSVLGASLENKGRIGNDAVNFLNTLIGALAALALVV